RRVQDRRAAGAFGRQAPDGPVLRGRPDVRQGEGAFLRGQRTRADGASAADRRVGVAVNADQENLENNVKARFWYHAYKVARYQREQLQQDRDNLLAEV